MVEVDPDGRKSSALELFRRASSWAVGVRIYAAGLAAFVAGCLWGLGYGLNYGVKNQVAYLLGGKRLLNPELLATDWYVTETTQYHAAFDRIAWLLLLLDENGWAIAIANVICAGIIAVGLWLALRGLSERLALPALLVTLAFAFSTRTVSLAVSYVLNPTLVPVTLAGTAFCLAMGTFARRRWLASGLWLAVSGYFHTNFAVLGFAMFAFAQVLAGWRPLRGRNGLLRRCALQLAPLTVVLLFLLPALMSAASGESIEEGRRILFEIRAPHHYAFDAPVEGLPAMAAWHIAGCGIGWRLLVPRATRRVHPFGALVISMIVALWSAVLLVTKFEVAAVSQAFVWRLAPFSELMCQALLAMAVVRVVGNPARARVDLGIPSIFGSIASLYIIGELAGEEVEADAAVTLAWLVGAPVVVVALYKIVRRLGGKQLRGGIAQACGSLACFGALALYVAAGLPRLQTFRERSELLEDESGADKLYAWIEKNTQIDDTFAVPPEMDEFRFNAMRPIVADWKSAPMIPSELVEWHRRLGVLAGFPRWTSKRTVVRGFRGADARRIEKWKEEFGVRYVLMKRKEKPHATIKARYSVAYKDARWIVFDVGDEQRP